MEFRVEDAINEIGDATSYQQTVLESLTKLMLQHTTALFLSNLTEAQNKKIQEALVERMINDIKKGDLGYDLKNMLQEKLGDIFNKAPEHLKGSIYKTIMEYVTSNLETLIDYRFKNKIEEIGNNLLDKWVENNIDKIEHKALDIIKGKLEGIFTSELATGLLKELSQGILQRKFRHILD